MQGPLPARLQAGRPRTPRRNFQSREWNTVSPFESRSGERTAIPGPDFGARDPSICADPTVAVRPQTEGFWPSPDRRAKEVEEYRPSPANDPTFAKLYLLARNID